MKDKLLFIVFLLMSVFLFAQKNNKNENLFDDKVINAINVNFLGNASLVSVNFERINKVRKKIVVAKGIGIGYNTEYRFCLSGGCGNSKPFFTMPHYITGNFGKKKEFLEFGLGGTFIIGKETFRYIPYPLLGYRLQSLQSHKSYFRLFISVPFHVRSEEEGAVVFSPLGISVGRSF